MPSLTVNLTESTSEFIAEEVAKGNFSDASQAAEQMLSHLVAREREYETKSAALELKLREGIESGLTEGDMEDVFRRVMKQAGLSGSLSAE